MHKKLLTSSLLLVVLALGVYLISAALTKSYVRAQVSSWKRTRPYASFTASLETHLPSGETLKTVYARRSDGSFVRSTDTGDLRSTRSIDLANGLKVVVHDRLNLKSTARDPVMFAKWSQSNERMANAGCDPETSAMTFLKEDVFLGRPVRAYVIHSVPKNAADLKITTWLDPGLDCYVVREELVENGKKTIKAATSIIIGEPDPKLFEYGQQLEVSPAEAGRRAMAALGVDPCVECEQSPVNVRREHYYQDHRPD